MVSTKTLAGATFRGIEKDKLNCYWSPCYRQLLAFIVLIQKPQRHGCNRLLVRSIVRIKEFLITMLPRGFQIGICNIPIGSTFSEKRKQILAEILNCGSP